MFKSIEKLHEFIGDYAAYKTTVWEEGHAIADEIEREVSEWYMPLPVDADGVPIHVGDRMLNIDGKPSLVVTSVSFTGFYTYFGCYYRGDTARHAGALFVEDVLREYGDAVDRFGQANVDMSPYADKLRELLGGDAE